MRKLLLFVAVAGLAFAGCSNGEGGDDLTVQTPPASAAAATATSPAASTTASPASACTDETSAAAGAPLGQKDFEFTPKCIVITTAQGLSIKNNGTVEHNFSVEGFAGLDVDLQPGDTNNTEATGLKAGNYNFFCKYHKASGMTGQLQVKAG